jgi:hypothetical protein
MAHGLTVSNLSLFALTGIGGVISNDEMARLTWTCRVCAILHTPKLDCFAKMFRKTTSVREMDPKR